MTIIYYQLQNHFLAQNSITLYHEMSHLHWTGTTSGVKTAYYFYFWQIVDDQAWEKCDLCPIKSVFDSSATNVRPAAWCHSFPKWWRSMKKSEWWAEELMGKLSQMIPDFVYLICLFTFTCINVWIGFTECSLKNFDC